MVDNAIIRLTIPVSKRLSLKKLKSIIDDFKAKNMTFGLLEGYLDKDVEFVETPDVFEIWREPLDCKDGQRLTVKNHPRIKNFAAVWDSGIRLDEVGIKVFKKLDV